MPEVFIELEVKYYLLKRLLGVATKDGSSSSKVKVRKSGRSRQVWCAVPVVPFCSCGSWTSISMFGHVTFSSGLIRASIMNGLRPSHWELGGRIFSYRACSPISSLPCLPSMDPFPEPFGSTSRARSYWLFRFSSCAGRCSSRRRGV